MGQQKSRLIQMKNKAKQCRSVHSIKEMLSVEKVDVNGLFSADDQTPVTPLWLAVKYGDVELTKLLLSVGAYVNAACGTLTMTPLHLAVCAHNIDLVHLLLVEGKANPNVLDKWNYTPLMYAAIHYEPFTVVQIFNLFIKHGCDVNFGATLNSNYEFDHNNVSVDLPELKRTYENGLITYVREPLGPISGTVLHLTVQNPYLPNEVLDILLSAGGDVNKMNLHGQTPLMGAILDTYYDYHSNVQNHVELLINNGANINIQDMRGWTSLHYAAQRGSIPCMTLLLKSRSDCDLQGVHLESPLWILMALGWREATRFLLMNGCDVNQPIRSATLLSMNQNLDICRYGFIYPIEFAICNRYYDIARLLVLVGCTVDDNTWMGSHLEPQDQRHVSFMTFLEESRQKKSSPQSLMEISRTCLRKSIGRGICVHLENMHLPQVLKDYVCFKE